MKESKNPVGIGKKWTESSTWNSLLILCSFSIAMALRDSSYSEKKLKYCKHLLEVKPGAIYGLSSSNRGWKILEEVLEGFMLYLKGSKEWREIVSVSVCKWSLFEHGYQRELIITVLTCCSSCWTGQVGENNELYIWIFTVVHWIVATQKICPLRTIKCELIWDNYLRRWN